MLAEIFGMDGIVVLIIVVVLLFGGAAIPKLARNLGSAKNEFERGLQDGKNAASPSATSPEPGSVAEADPAPTNGAAQSSELTDGSRAA